MRSNTDFIRTFFEKIINWLVRVLSWIKKELNFYSDSLLLIDIFIIVFVIPAFIFELFTSEFFRLSGMLCQLSGLISIVFDLYGTNKAFGIIKDLKRKLKTFPKFNRPPPLELKISAISSVATSSGAYLSTKPNLTIDEKLNALEEKIEKEIKKITNKMNHTFTEQNKKIKKEMQERTQADKEVRELIKKVNTENYFWIFWGVILLSIGIVFLSVP